MAKEKITDEELITRIKGQKNGRLIIERPMVFKSLTMTDPFGRAKEVVQCCCGCSFR